MYKAHELIENAKANISTATEQFMGFVLYAYKNLSERNSLIAWQVSLCQPDHKDVLPISRCRNANDGLLHDLLLIMIVDLAESFNLPEGKNISVQQARDTSMHIILKFTHFSVEDVAVCLERIKEGAYGKVFALDTNKMLEYLNKYDQEREAALRLLREQTASSTEGKSGDWALKDPGERVTRNSTLKQNMDNALTRHEIKQGPKEKEAKK